MNAALLSARPGCITTFIAHHRHHHYLTPPKPSFKSNFRSTPSFHLSTSHSPALMASETAAAGDSSKRTTSDNAGAEVPERTKSEEVIVQYVVLRRYLIDTWPLGSVVTQGCHASVAAIWSHKDDAHTLDYFSLSNLDSMHKVTLEVKGEAQILNLSEKITNGSIDHKLWTEQPENIPTCLATKPYPKSLVSTFFKKLKLCK